jgi:gas vesicle protein
MDGDERPSADLLIAALLGAAVGAGVGLIASRAFADDSSTMDRAVRQIRRRTRTVGRAMPDVAGLASSVSDSVSDARRAAERTFKEEMRAMRRALRRRRRELGL